MVICVDFDGTCVEHCYPDVGQSAPQAVRVLKKLVEQGHKLILWTMRDAIELGHAQQWFKDNEIPLYASQRNPTQDDWTLSPKCHAQLYIDDAAFGCPLIQPFGYKRPCVDWKAVEAALIKE